jgi:hypothetical protein
MQYKLDRIKSILNILEEYRKLDPDDINPKTFEEKILSKIAQKDEPDYIHDIFVTARLVAQSGVFRSSDGKAIFAKVSQAFSAEILTIFIDIYTEDKRDIQEEKQEFQKLIDEIKKELKL